jgi:hypothetical protein
MTFTTTFDRTDQEESVSKTGGSTQTITDDALRCLTGNAETAVPVTAMTYDLGDMTDQDRPERHRQRRDVHA